jgi:uncharacterized protein YegL
MQTIINTESKIDMEQNPFTQASAEFAENPEPRCASVLLLDVSASMAGDSIQQLQDGLMVYKDQLAADDLARKRVEVAVVTFGGSVQVANTFTTAEFFNPPSLVATGDTPMGSAVLTALDLVRSRKEEYKTAGAQYFQPWVFLITDGAPTDVNTPQWTEAIRRVHDEEDRKVLSFFAVGVENADMERLRQLSKRAPVKLKGLDFRSLFEWLSRSQQSVSRSRPGDAVPVSNPTAPDGWAAVG